MPLHVFSGKCEHGRCGMKTAIIDAVDNQLRVGDIVATATIDEHGICSFNGLSVVFDDRPKLVGREESTGPFVMGLYSVDFSNDDNGWYIHRVKKWEDVVEGEHWKDFGFNYKVVDDN